MHASHSTGSGMRWRQRRWRRGQGPGKMRTARAPVGSKKQTDLDGIRFNDLIHGLNWLNGVSYAQRLVGSWLVEIQ